MRRPKAPPDVGVLSMLSILHQRHNDAERAIVLGISALKLDPTPNPKLWLSLCRALAKAEHYEQSLALLERFEKPGVEITQEDRARAYHIKAKTLARLGKMREANDALMLYRSLRRV